MTEEKKSCGRYRNSAKPGGRDPKILEALKEKFQKIRRGGSTN
jgi:hypothetical protein